MKKRLVLTALRSVLWWIILVWCRTLSITAVRNEGLDALRRSGKNYVIAFWHGSMLLGWFLHRPRRNEHMSALVSQSEDGEFLSAVLERWKYFMIRGSSHIGGKEAMQLMVQAVHEGKSLAITPDGPRGPRHEMKMGAVRIAQKTNVPLVLAGIAVGHKRQLRSWDKFEVPLPFSNVAVVYSEPIYVPQDLDGMVLDEYKIEQQRRLQNLTEEAESILSASGENA
ncbi:MAG: lysophospholipid acyltransferase family protein [Bacteroidota bacterium]